MRITFLMPGYTWGPSGGCKVVYEYANRLVGRGHQVCVVHPRRLKYTPTVRPESMYSWARAHAIGLLELVRTPTVDWQTLDPRVNVVHVPSSDARHIPDGDAIFATDWHTVRSVLECPHTRGERFYLIQGYETWQGPKHLVDATWRSPLHKVVISKWLLDLGRELECRDMVCIPNAIDHHRYKLTRPLDSRPLQVATMFSSVPVKGSADGIEALRVSRAKHPNLKIVSFGTSRRLSWVPQWMEYHRNPPQDFIVNEIYNGSRIFLSSSWSEGFALPAAEAAACGCAVVATDSGGTREFIENGVTGLLSPPKEPAALAENLCLLLENDDLRMRLAKASNSYVTHLNWDRSAALLEDFITGALRHDQVRQLGVPA
jgi:L-malate glycosyltransferase